MKSLLFLGMKLLSLFKFKRKKIDIKSLLEDMFNRLESNLFTEFDKGIYNWTKSDSIKHHECFIFSKFLIDYSFSISHKDLDKNTIISFNKISEEVFIDLYNKKYTDILDYKNMKNIIEEKYNSLTLLRKENKPPECWHLIYCSLTEKNTLAEIQTEISGLEKAIQSMQNKVGLNDLVSKFRNGIDQKLKMLESFDLAEILFRQNIRLIKKELSSTSIPQQLSAKR